MFTHLLPKLLAKITGKPRYLPKIVWSEKSFVHNAFRLYELIFWRRYGIRPESFASIDEHGKIHREFYSIEAMLAHIETIIREGFYVPDSIKIFVPRLITPQGFQLTSGFLFAIAVDTPTSTATGASPRTLSHTCSTGSDRLLLVASLVAQTSQTVTGVTYNAVSMTGSISVAPDSGPNYYYIKLWYLFAPATGANNIVATASSNVGMQALSYSGAKQSGFPDASTTVGPSQASPINGTVTVVAADSWMAMFGSDGAGNPTAGTGTTQRGSGTPGGAGFFDSNGALAAGSRTLQMTWTGGSTGNAVVVSFAPAAAVTTVTPSAIATTLTLNAPTVVISDTVTPSALATTLTLNAPSLKTDDSFAPSAFGLALTLNAPSVLTGNIVTPSAFALTSAIPAPAISRDWTVSVSALSITSALLSTSYALTTKVTPSALALTLEVLDPASRWNNRSKTPATWTIREKV